MKIKHFLLVFLLLAGAWLVAQDHESNKPVGYVRAEINDLSTVQAKNIFSQDARPLFQALGEEIADFKTVFKIGLKNDLLVLKEFTDENS